MQIQAVVAASESVEEIATAALIALATGLVGLIGAVTTAWYQRRDARTRVGRQLELAAQRTDFAVTWLNAHRAVAEDTTASDDVKRRALDELEEAYAEAQVGFDAGIALQRDGAGDRLKRILRQVSLFWPGLSAPATLLVAAFYAMALPLFFRAWTDNSFFVEDGVVERFVWAMLEGLIWVVPVRIALGWWLRRRGYRPEPAVDLSSPGDPGRATPPGEITDAIGA